jgi:hypothetical protein
MARPTGDIVAEPESEDEWEGGDVGEHPRGGNEEWEDDQDANGGGEQQRANVIPEPESDEDEVAAGDDDSSGDSKEGGENVWGSSNSLRELWAQHNPVMEGSTSFVLGEVDMDYSVYQSPAAKSKTGEKEFPPINYAAEWFS